MDVSVLVAETVKYLAPALPFLHETSVGAAKKLGEKITEASLERAGKIWQWLRPKAQERPALGEAAQEVAARPVDADAQAALRVQLRKLLEVTPALAEELATLVGRPSAQGSSVSVSGAGAVGIGGNATGNTITTNRSGK